MHTLASIQKNLPRVAWLIPFITFLAGYLVTGLFCTTPTADVPNLINLSTHEALDKLATLTLNARVALYKETPDLPDGTILAQTPQAGTKVRSHQTVLLVISKKPTAFLMPNFIHKTGSEITTFTQKLGLTCLQIHAPSNARSLTCFSQFPSAGTIYTGGPIIIYISAPAHKSFIMPDLKNKKIKEVADFLSQHHVSYSIMHSTDQKHECSDTCLVVDQHPIAGSWVELEGNNKVVVQLQGDFYPPGNRS
jgi:serine/threonine-protein kinase